PIASYLVAFLQPRERGIVIAQRNKDLRERPGIGVFFLSELQRESTRFGMVAGKRVTLREPPGPLRTFGRRFRESRGCLFMSAQCGIRLSEHEVRDGLLRVHCERFLE